MKTRSRRLAAIAGSLLVVLVAGPLPADDEDDSDAVSEADKKLQQLIDGAVGWYELFPDAESQTPLTAQVLLRWRNGSRGQRREDLMAAWIDHGRPVAIASIFPWEGFLCHEFASLSPESKLVARDGEAVVWGPTTPGVDFRTVPDDSPPAETAAARLRQMKALAERFSATMTGWKADDSDREQLRLLPRPLYRCDIKAARDAHPDLIDGALFAFVQGTDPEAVLVLEAVRSEGVARWRYAFARATSGGLEARLDGEQVWVAPKYPENRTPAKPQITLRRVLDVAEPRTAR